MRADKRLVGMWLEQASDWLLIWVLQLFQAVKNSKLPREVLDF